VLNISIWFNNILFLGIEGEVKRILLIDIKGLDKEVKGILLIDIDRLDKEVRRIIEELDIKRDVRILITFFNNTLFLYNYNSYLFIGAYFFFKTLRL
jgi:hypothetical protein